MSAEDEGALDIQGLNEETDTTGKEGDQANRSAWADGSQGARASCRRPQVRIHAHSPRLVSRQLTAEVQCCECSPKVYKALKEAQSVDEAEEVVRDRLEEAGVQFSGRYPSARDISAAKKKRARDKELEDIDTSLIIDSGRPRRSAAQSVSYAPAPIPDTDGVAVNGSGATADEEEEAEFEEEEDDEDDADEDASASGSDESESEF
jgi:hypothetical protein